MPRKPIFINGIQYSWGTLTVTAFGVPLNGITSLSYSVTRKFSKNYGAGDQPIGGGYGNYEYTGGKMTLYKEEVDAMAANSPTGSILDLPLGTISILFSGTGVVPRVEKIRNVVFTSDPLSTKQNDTNIMCDISFDFAGVDK